MSSSAMRCSPFSARRDQPDHADRAVGAALAIDAFARRFSAEQEARGIPFGHTRIGVHSGLRWLAILALVSG